MARSHQEQLDALDALIAQIEAENLAFYGANGKQSSTLAGQLRTLYAQRTFLEQTVAAESSTNFRLAAPARRA